ncbi:MAG: hypothetical protein LBK98_11615, partial [Peptococcaceae bacterium]|nr:hypothetical protein [Peptococcaceae bacterium]
MRKMIKRTLLFSLVALLICGLTLSGCGASQASNTGAGTGAAGGGGGQAGGGEAAPPVEGGGQGGAQDSAASPASFIFPMPGDVASLSYLQEGLKDEGDIMLGGVYDPLYVVTGQGINYYLAEKAEVSEDMTELTVTLRENLLWHDGAPITA